MELVMTSVKKFRSMMAELNIPNNAKPTIFLKLADDDLCKVFTQEKSVIQALVKAEGVTILGKSEQEPEGCVKGFVSDEISVYLLAAGLIDFKANLNRLEKDHTRISKAIETLVKKTTAA